MNPTRWLDARSGGPVRVAVGTTAIATLLVGTANIGRSFNYDEAVTYTAFINEGSPWRALTNQVVFNNHQMFSVTQAILWRLGFVGETAQRLGPVLCGVAAVALLTWWVGRRVGAAAGAIAGFLLLLNPVYVNEFRLLRGYSLATLAVLVAAVTTHHTWHDPRRRWLVISGIAMTTAVTTHAYSVVPIAVVATVTLVQRRLRRDHLITWASAAVAAIIIQLPLLDDARRTSEARGTRYLSWFGELLVETYLGGRQSAQVLSVVLLAAGGWAVARRSRRHAASAVTAAALVTLVVVLLWQVIQPYDLYPRFFIALVPFLAALAAYGAHALPYRSGLVAGLVLVVLMAPQAFDVIEHEAPLRDAADVAVAARESGLTVCGKHWPALNVYVNPTVNPIDPPTPTEPDRLDGCDVYVVVLGLNPDERRALGDIYERRVGFGGGVVIYGPESFAPQVIAIRDR